MSGEIEPAVLDRRKVLIGLGLAACSGVAIARQPVPNHPRLETKALGAMIPARIGAFAFDTTSGLVLPPPDALSDRLYDNLITRTYARPDGKVAMLLIAYNNRQDGVLQIHRPEICYPAGGFVLTPTRPVDTPLGGGAPLPSQTFVARSEMRTETVLYWTRVDDAFPRRWIEQRLVVARRNLEGVIPDGVLVRVSTLSGGGADDLPLLTSFVTDLHRQSPGALRQLLFARS
ncbi:exosortase-associated protein EpsI, V-type [Tsuneonella sp. HG249]